MKRSSLIKLLSLLVCASMLISMLAACDGEVGESTEPQSSDATENITNTRETEQKPTEAATFDGTESSVSDKESEPYEESSSDTEDEGSETDIEESKEETSAKETDTDPEIDISIYGDGAEIEIAGDTLGEGAFALGEYPVLDCEPKELSAAELLALLAQKDQMQSAMPYKVTEPIVLASDTSYYGSMAALIAEGGIIIKDADNIVIKDLIVIGKISIEGSSNITFNNVDINGEAIALSIDGQSKAIAFDSCKISADETAVISAGANVSIYETAIAADKAILSSGTDLTVQNSRIDAKSAAIVSSGAYAIVRQNTVNADADGVGIDFSEGSYNGLIALNDINGVKRSVNVDRGYNCVVLLNSAVCISGTKNTNLYVVENSLGGIIELKDNKYLLCDENSFLSGSDKVISLRNSEYNGSDLHDINARVEYGANEELLPHTNKDLFLTMERRKNVTDLSLLKETAYVAYVTSKAIDDDVVIVPPGAYSAMGSLGFSQGHEGTTFYAYGVYQEKAVMKDKYGMPSGTLTSSLGTALNVIGNSIYIHGLTVGYDFQSSGQVYVLEKYVDPKYGNCIKVVTNAGYVNGFSGTNDDVFAKVGSGYVHGIKGDTVMGQLGEDSTTSTVTLKYIGSDPTGIMTYKMEDLVQYNDIEKGDVIVCRLGGNNASSIILNATDILMKDCVLYGYTAALGIMSNTREATNIRLERFHNTAHSAPLISKRDYQWYKALERIYGLTSDGDYPLAEGALGLEVYIDENGNYRGGLPRYASVDATHITGAGEGVSATSSLFEQMCDDGTNQRSSSARIAGYKDNGDGTTTLYFKGSLVRTYFNLNIASGIESSGPTGNEVTFKKGDTIFAYTSEGHTLIEAEVLSDSRQIGALPSGIHLVHIDSNNDCVCDEASCKALLHRDDMNASGKIKRDCKCDVCGITVHVDYDTENLHYGTGSGKCRTCGFPTVDEDGDHFADNDKRAYVLTQMESDVKYDPKSSNLSYKMYAWNHRTGGPYTIEYKTQIKSVLVKTSDVDFDAFEGRDLTDNDFFMIEKILCDNLSLNSANVTFDNVLMRDYRARGVLAKTVDVTIKNCTFRNVLKTGVLLSIETSWGESTVPKNITIENCWFDHTGDLTCKNDLKYSGVSLMGLGDLEGKITVSEKTLPSRNIKIIGNKFDGVKNNYIISISAAQNVVIKDNLFIARDAIEGDKYDTPRLLYINGAMNVEVSDNSFENFTKPDIKDIIKAYNYKGLHGTDVEGILDEESDRLPLS